MNKSTILKVLGMIGVGVGAILTDYIGDKKTQKAIEKEVKGYFDKHPDELKKLNEELKEEEP